MMRYIIISLRTRIWPRLISLTIFVATHQDALFSRNPGSAHRYIAEKFLEAPPSAQMKLVGAKNGNKLDCRLENLEWRTRSTSSRNRKTTSKTGYTGVYIENKKYRAIITINGKAVHIGMFDTPEDAARAYNKRAKEVYGEMAKLNKIKRKKKEATSS